MYPVPLLHQQLQSAGDPAVAEGQMAYMRNQFAYCGLKMPAWSAQVKDFFKTHGYPDATELKTAVRACFEDEYREMQYAGLEMVQHSIKKQPPEFIDFLEELIQTKSWWDTVDWINKLVGIHFKRYPQLIEPVTVRWMDSGNIWLQRVCLIFQLTYKDKTDSELLFRYATLLSGSKEFFIQKAIGWALRQYSSSNPQAVADFVNSTPLAPLSKREALRKM